MAQHFKEQHHHRKGRKARSLLCRQGGRSGIAKGRRGGQHGSSCKRKERCAESWKEALKLGPVVERDETSQGGCL